MDGANDRRQFSAAQGGQPIAAPVDAASSARCDAVAPARLLDGSRLSELHRQFIEEYQPVGPTQAVLVARLARHVAAGERWEAGGDAVGRLAARHLPALVSGAATGGDGLDDDGLDDDGLHDDGLHDDGLHDDGLHDDGLHDDGLHDDGLHDDGLAAAVTNEAADRCERHSLRRWRALLQAFAMLQEIQAAAREREGHAATMPPLSFADEAACEQYLVERLRRGAVRCPKCGATEGSFLVARKRRECRGCRTQVGMRDGTVMACSAIPLRRWFDAVRHVLWQPTISAAELAESIGLARGATARSMKAKILAALAADDASAQLAGLDRRLARAVVHLNEALPAREKKPEQSRASARRPNKS